MNLQEIKELMQTMAQTGVTSLDWNSCGAAVHLERQNLNAAECCQENQYADRQEILETQMDDVSKSKDKASNNEQSVSDASQEQVEDEELPGEIVKSPVVGVFYSSPSPDSEPFVRPGGRIEKGSPLCIIEAMKLMNEVSSPCSGEIAEIMVENGQRVEYGQPMFRIV